MTQNTLQRQPKSFLRQTNERFNGWVTWTQPNWASHTDDKTEDRKSHKQAATEVKMAKHLKGNSAFGDVHGFQTSDVIDCRIYIRALKTILILTIVSLSSSFWACENGKTTQKWLQFLNVERNIYIRWRPWIKAEGPRFNDFSDCFISKPLWRCTKAKLYYNSNKPAYICI